MTDSKETAVVTRASGLMSKIADRYGVDADKMNSTLKQTAFRQRGKDGKPAAEVTNEQMMALMVVADQFQLNPFTREIYAFVSEGGVVPVIGIDGWIRIINARPELESIEFSYAEEGSEEPWIACTIVRKDRAKPLTVREYLNENYRKTPMWDQMPKRMLRHRALIQCARVAFGFSGIMQDDEAEAMEERRFASAKDVTPPKGKPETKEPARKSARKDPAPPAGDPPPPMLSVDQTVALADKLREEGVADSLLLAKLEVGSLADIPAARFGAALQWIEELSAA